MRLITIKWSKLLNFIYENMMDIKIKILCNNLCASTQKPYAPTPSHINTNICII